MAATSPRLQPHFGHPRASVAAWPSTTAATCSTAAAGSPIWQTPLTARTTSWQPPPMERPPTMDSGVMVCSGTSQHGVLGHRTPSVDGTMCRAGQGQQQQQQRRSGNTALDSGGPCRVGGRPVATPQMRGYPPISGVVRATAEPVATRKDTAATPIAGATPMPTTSPRCTPGGAPSPPHTGAAARELSQCSMVPPRIAPPLHEVPVPQCIVRGGSRGAVPQGVASATTNSCCVPVVRSVSRVRSPSAQRPTECSVNAECASPKSFPNAAVTQAEPVPSACNTTPEEHELLYQHVQYFFRTHPQMARHHTIVRKEDSIYEIDEHEVELAWQHAAERWKPGQLVVVDGPLRQPLVDYLTMSEANAEYDTHTIAKMSALHHVPKERRMTFDDGHKKYSRLEAMRVAKEQALIREQAADYAKEGRQVPDDLVRKYNKALRQKLRVVKSREDDLPPTMSPDAASGSGTQPAEAASLTGTGSPSGSVQASAAAPADRAQVVTLMAHRGISLNGVPAGVGGLPSYIPTHTQAPNHPPRITRSWSGSSMPATGPAGTAPGQPPHSNTRLSTVATAVPGGVVVPAQLAGTHGSLPPPAAGTSPMASARSPMSQKSAQSRWHALR